MTTCAGWTGSAGPTGRSTPARDYSVGSPEHDRLATALAEVRTAGHDVPNMIGGRPLRTGRTYPLVVPHQHQVHLGQVHAANAGQVDEAISAATATW